MSIRDLIPAVVEEDISHGTAREVSHTISIPDAAVPRGGEFIAAASGFSWGGSIAALAVVSLFSAASVCGCAPAHAKGAPLSTPNIALNPTKRLAAAAGTPAVSPAAAAARQ